jgi:hypothetical protein
MYSIGNKKRIASKGRKGTRKSTRKHARKSTRKPCNLGLIRSRKTKRCIKKKCPKSQLRSTVTGKCVPRNMFNEVANVAGKRSQLQEALRRKQVLGPRRSQRVSLKSPIASFLGLDARKSSPSSFRSRGSRGSLFGNVF